MVSSTRILTTELAKADVNVRRRKATVENRMRMRDIEPPKGGATLQLTSSITGWNTISQAAEKLPRPELCVRARFHRLLKQSAQSALCRARPWSCRLDAQTSTALAAARGMQGLKPSSKTTSIGTSKLVP